MGFTSIELVESNVAVEAANVVVATGPFQQSFIPEVSTRLGDGIHQLHSSEYRNPLVLPDGPVLVVGAGNSGAQISLELARSRKVWLASQRRHAPRTADACDAIRFRQSPAPCFALLDRKGEHPCRLLQFIATIRVRS